MKKVLVILLSVLVALSMSGCGNKMWLEFNNDFDNAYVLIGTEWMELKIDSWQDYEGEQLLLKLPDGTLLLVNSMNCILYTGELPIN